MSDDFKIDINEIHRQIDKKYQERMENYRFIEYIYYVCIKINKNKSDTYYKVK